MSTNVSSVASHFPDVENGFTTTASALVSSGAATVQLASVGGYTNGEPVVLVIDPTDVSKKQTFTGIMDTAGSQVTSVVWTAGTNQSHSLGATVVDYATATHIAMMSKGIKVEHNQDGTHKAALITSRTEDTSPDIGADYLLTYDTSATALKKVKPTNLGLMTGWIAGQLPAVSSVTNNGNRSYDVTFASSVASYLTPGQRLRFTPTVSRSGYQCTSLNGTTQYWSRASASITGTLSTITDDITVSAWVKLTSYGSTGTIVSRYTGGNGWSFDVNNSGQIRLTGYNAGAGNSRQTSTYQSLPLNKWVHVSASLDMSGWTTATNKTMIDGVDVPIFLASTGTNPTAWVNSGGNLEVGTAAAGSFFPGKVSNVAIFNGNVSTVTQANIRSYMNQTQTGSETNCIFFCSFNNTTNDSSASANNLSAGAGSPTATNADAPFSVDATGTVGSYDYGIVTKVATTVATVQVPEGNTIPTSGGVTTVDMSPWKAPYNMPVQSSKWRLSSLLNVLGTVTSNATFGSFLSNGWALSVPIGAWDVGWQAGLYSTTTTPVFLNISSASLTGLTSGQSVFLSRYQAVIQSTAAATYTNTINIRNNENLSSASTFLMYSMGATTSAGVDSNGVNEIFAELSYL